MSSFARAGKRIGAKEMLDKVRAEVRIRMERKKILPVAALSTPESEVRAVYRAKKRPAVIVAEEGVSLPGEFTLGKPAWQTAPTLLVAPYYGTEEGDKREGFNPAFLDRVLKCEYSRFMLDWLPIEGSPGGSLLRIDPIQPIGSHHNSLEPSRRAACLAAGTQL